MGIFRRTGNPVPSPSATGGTYRTDVNPTPAPAPIPIPSNSVVPVITAARKVGEVVTVTPGTWNVATPKTYQWYRNGVAIAGEVNPTYLAVSADVSATLVVKETITNVSGSATVTSNACVVTAAVAVLPTIIIAPLISFAQPAIVGTILTRVVGTYANAVSLAGQWTRDNVNIAGATTGSYTIVTADLGKLIRYVETATNPDGNVVATTAAVGPTVSDIDTTLALKTWIFSTGPTDFSITRNADGATFVNSSGTLIVAAANQPRYHHSALNTFEGLYMEKSKTNKCSHNTQLGLASLWTAGAGVTVTVGGIADPSGGTSASRLLITAGVAYRGIVRGVTGTTGSIRHSLYGRSRSGSPRTMTIRHPALGYQDVIFGTSWTRVDFVGINEGADYFNMNILVNDTNAADVEIWLEDVTPNGVVTDSLIQSALTERVRPVEVLNLQVPGLSGNKDVLFTFNDGSTQVVSNQAISSGVISISANVLNKTLVRQVAVFNLGTSAAPPPSPPPAGGGNLGNFVIIGDSLHRGDDVSLFYSPANNLRSKLTTGGFTFTNKGDYLAFPGSVPVQSNGGWKWSTINNTPALNALAALAPKTILVSLGTNDMGVTGSIGTVTTDALNAIEAACAGTVTTIFAAVPNNPGYFGGTEFNDMKNAYIAWVNVAPSKRKYIDLNLSNLVSPEDYYDSTHWTTTGAEKIASTEYYYINLFLGSGTAPAPPPAPTPAPPPSGVIYNIETVIDSMKGPNDNLYYLATAPNTGEQIGADKHYTYIAVGRNRSDGQSYWPGEYLSDSTVQGRTVPSTGIMLLPWYVYGRRAGAPDTATNTRLQIRNGKLFALLSNNTWQTLSTNDAGLYDGANWHANFRSPGNETLENVSYGSGLTDVRADGTDGQSLGSIGAGTRSAWAIHGFPVSHNTSRSFWLGIKGTLWVHEARLILHNGAGTDDRATSGLLAWIGADWYFNGSWVQENCHARLRIVTNNWNIYTLTDIPESVLRAAPLPPGFS